MRYSDIGIHVFHTTDNGSTFAYQSTLPPCNECFNSGGSLSFTAGRAPGSFYYMRAPLIDSTGQIAARVCIDYSDDYAKTFVSHCFFLDSLYTGIENRSIPQASFGLSCHPNPFVLTTEINYMLVRPGNVNILIYDLNGNLLSSLACGNQPTGTGSFIWNGRDNNGNDLTPGIYMLTLEVDGIAVKTAKAVIISN
jgi:hypothetical protein